MKPDRVVLGVELDLLRAVEAVNDRQKRVLLGKLTSRLGPGLDGRQVAVWGLSFKAETDDMRESPALPLIDGILRANGVVRAHDPKAIESAREIFGDRLYYARDPYDAVAGADALVIVTEWLVYRNPDFDRLKSLLTRPLIIDGRNLFDPGRMARMGFEYDSIGRPRP
jgi:UDPglucose 6-dehydrogenase